MGLFVKVFLLVIAQIVLIIACVFYHIDDFEFEQNAQDVKFKQMITAVNDAIFQKNLPNSNTNEDETVSHEKSDSSAMETSEESTAVQPAISSEESILKNQSQIKNNNESITEEIQETTNVIEQKIDKKILKTSEKVNATITEKTSKERTIKKEKEKVQLINVNKQLNQKNKTTVITDAKVKQLFEKKKAQIEQNNEMKEENTVVPQNSANSETSSVSTKAIQKEISSIVNENRIIFKRLSTEVTQKSIQTIEKIAQILKENPTVKVEIGGHTDAKGDDEVNAYVSKHRALSVQKLLVKFGIAPERLSAVGYGESKPIVQNDSQGYSAKNRRVEFKIIKE